MFSIILAVLAATATPTCTYDPKIFSLGFDAFDQDMKGGWRALSDQPGCETKAADIIREYRRKHAGQLRVLFWHEGQLRAEAGDAAAAVALMEQSRTAERDVIGWDAYVDATIAFLLSDRAALDRARARLAAWPRPANDEWTIEPGDAWPPNLDVVDGFKACFGKSYQVAYGEACRPKKAAIRP